MSQPEKMPDAKVHGQKPAWQSDPLQPQDAPGNMPDFAEEYTTVGVDKDFWKAPFVEVEKDRRKNKHQRVI